MHPAKTPLVIRILELFEDEDLTYHDVVDALSWVRAKLDEQWKERSYKLDALPTVRAVKDRANDLYRKRCEDDESRHTALR